MKLICKMTCCAALTFTCSLAYGGLSVSESFSYAPTSAINGANGGAGWASAWTGSNNVASPGLEFPNIQTAGNRIATDGGDFGSFRNLSSAMTTGGATPIFIGFLVNSTGTPASPSTSYAGISLYHNNAEQFFMGMPFGRVNYGWDIQPGTGAGAINSDGPAVDGTTDFLVYRLSQGTGNTTNVELFANPTPGQPLPAPTASRLNFRTNFAFNRIRIQAGTGSDVHLNFDELRIGDSFDSIAPYPFGDYNHDGTVDAADYVVWRKTDGTQSGYNLWRTHFGETVGGGAGAALDASHAAVPEPGTKVLMLAGINGVVLARARRAGRPRNR